MPEMPFREKHLNTLSRIRNSDGNGKKKARPHCGDRASVIGVAVTYFRVRMHTIIGANPFHYPVRDGKEWVQVAIAATKKAGRNKAIR